MEEFDIHGQLENSLSLKIIRNGLSLKIIAHLL